jgi:hypothetical protein
LRRGGFPKYLWNWNLTKIKGQKGEVFLNISGIGTSPKSKAKE